MRKFSVCFGFCNFVLVRAVLVSIAVVGLMTASPIVSSAAWAQEQPAGPEKVAPNPDKAASTAEKPEQEEDDLLLPMKRDAWFHQLRAYPNAKIPQGAYWHAQMQKQALVARRFARFQAAGANVTAQADPFSSAMWTADGPQPVTAYYGTTAYSGRATSIAVSPSDPNTVYLGTAAGGVWKTTDGGVTWTPLTDSQASLAIGAVAIDPNNPNTVYAGTGEPNFSGDSWYGQGLLKSTDAGSTWTLIRTPFTTGDTAPDFTAIAVQQGNSNVVLAANLAGLYRSADGGQTWTEVLSPGGDAGVTAVMFDVVNPNIAYAGLGGYYATAAGTVYMSTDAGQTWTSISGSGTGSIPVPSAVLRTALAEDSAGKTLYAAFANSGLTAPGTLYSTAVGGATGSSWTQLSSPSSNDGLDWYRNAIAVSPINPQVLYATGVNLYESTNGGRTWTKSTGTPLYSDQHALVFSADGARMYVADDGGVFVSTTSMAANATFASLNTAIDSLTFYPGFSLVPGKANSLLAGSQDHGLNLYTGSLAWPNGEQSGFCGDGGSVYIDPQGTYAYAHCEGGSANWAANPTADSSVNSWVAAQTGISTSDRLPWVADIKGDQQTMSTVYTATNHLYQSINYAGSWTSISPDLTGGSSTIATIGVSPSDSKTIYTGAGDGTVSVTSNALSGTSATWTTLSGLPDRSITKISVQPDSAQDVYLTVSGFDTGHVFHSTDGGSTWADISGDLPNTPVDSILVDPNLLYTIYLATDTGVYVTENGGTNWAPLGQGLPNVVVQDILMYQPTRILRVITHGRGAWETTLPLVGLQSSQLSLQFASQAQGTSSSAQTLTLTNNLGSASLSLTGFQITGPFAQTNNCGATLASGASCTVSVVFSPTTAGIAAGSLVASSSTNSVTIGLGGTGLGAPGASLGATSLNFSSQPVGVPSATQTVQLSNNGDASLTNIAISISGGNAGEFFETNNCGTSVAAGANCTITAMFTPAGTGARSATLSVTDNAAGSPQSVALSGSGDAPFTVSAASSSATVSAGTSASYQLTLTAAQGFPLESAVQLSCSGLPSLSSCSFSPTSVASGVATQNIALTISTTPASSAAHASNRRTGTYALAAISLFSLLLLPRRRSRSWLVVLIALTIGLSGCSGGSSSTSSGGSGPTNPGTSAGTYTVTVTAAQSTTYQTSQTLTLTVQ